MTRLLPARCGACDDIAQDGKRCMACGARHCPRCGAWKVGAFGRDERRRDGVAIPCRACVAEQTATWKAANPEKDKRRAARAIAQRSERRAATWPRPCPICGAAIESKAIWATTIQHGRCTHDPREGYDIDF